MTFFKEEGILFYCISNLHYVLLFINKTKIHRVDDNISRGIRYFLTYLLNYFVSGECKPDRAQRVILMMVSISHADGRQEGVSQLIDIDKFFFFSSKGIFWLADFLRPVRDSPVSPDICHNFRCLLLYYLDS